jgi:hypothetical protein
MELLRIANDQKTKAILFHMAQVWLRNDIPPEREPRQSWNSTSLYYLIAQTQPQTGLWREGGGKTFGPLLFRADIGAQAHFLVAKRFFVPPYRFGKLPCQHMG